MIEKLAHTDYNVKQVPIYTRRKLRVICIGAGASGIYMSIRQDQLLRDVDFQVYEKNEDVGGTWLENKYPGAACDIPSHNYTFSFAGKADWTAYYSGTDEIQGYFRDLADKYKLDRFIKYQHKVVAARWNDQKYQYEIEVDTPQGRILDSCHVLINACGIHNAWKWPNIPGLNDFKGDLLHSARFDRSWSPKGKRVAMIGNGSSGIQILPQIQPDATRVDAYVRSPTWIATPFVSSKNPNPDRNPLYTEEEKQRFADDPEYALQYRCEMEHEFNYFFDNFIDGSSTQLTTKAALEKIMAERLARKPELIDKLTPKFGVGCRRITPGVNYLESLCEDNVEVITDDIDHVLAHSVVTKDGIEREVDSIICATGFDVSFAPRFELVGADGYKCDEKFGEDAKGYLSLAIAGLPNYFIFYGPQACAANGSFLPAMEASGDYFIKAIQKIQAQNIASMMPKPEAVEDLVLHADKFHERTVWVHGCRSWYKNGTTDGRVAAVWPGSTLHFRETLQDPRWEDYDYVYLDKATRFSYLGNGTTWLEVNGGERSGHVRDRAHLFDEWWAERSKELEAKSKLVVSGEYLKQLVHS